MNRTELNDGCDSENNYNELFTTTLQRSFEIIPF